MDETILVQELGQLLEFSYTDMLCYAGPYSPAGVAIALKVMQRAFAALSPNQPPPRRTKLIADAFALMGPLGVFVQFTYGLLSPIPREVCANRYSAVRSRPILLNLPPAFVWTYRLDTTSGEIAGGR